MTLNNYYTQLLRWVGHLPLDRLELSFILQPKIIALEIFLCC